LGSDIAQHHRQLREQSLALERDKNGRDAGTTHGDLFWLDRALTLLALLVEERLVAN